MTSLTTLSTKALTDVGMSVIYRKKKKLESLRRWKVARQPMSETPNKMLKLTITG